MSPKIVAFMQNPWFFPGTSQRIIDKYTLDQHFHRKVLGKCMSGKRLMEAFGDFYEKIWWDNASPIPGHAANAKQPPDFNHIRGVLSAQLPNLIITFGRMPTEALRSLMLDIPILYCHHPNARHKTQDDLNQFAQEVRQWAMNWEEQHGSK